MPLPNHVPNGSFEVDTSSWTAIPGSQGLSNPLASSTSITVAVDGTHVGSIFHGGSANSDYYTDVPVEAGVHMFSGSYAQTGTCTSDEGFSLSIVSGVGDIDVAPATGPVGQVWTPVTGQVTMESSGIIRITASHHSTSVGSFWMDALQIVTQYFPNGEELYDDLRPLIDVWGDPTNDLRVYSSALGLMLQPIDDMIKDGPNGEPGWSQILDLTRAKDEWLPWLGQWVGYQVPAKASTETQAAWSARERQRIVTRASNRRATVAMLREVVQEQLTGTKTVIIQERTTTPHTISVYVYNSEIATSTALAQAAALSQKAYGLTMVFTVLTGANYNLLAASNASYTVMTGKHANYNSVLTNPGL
jgi:hypothetical protein